MFFTQKTYRHLVTVYFVSIFVSCQTTVNKQSLVRLTTELKGECRGNARPHIITAGSEGRYKRIEANGASLLIRRFTLAEMYFEDAIYE